MNTTQRQWLEQLWTNHHTTILNYLLHKTNGDRHLAEDLTTDTFLSAATANYTENNNADRWLKRIARNRFIDHTRLSRVKHETTHNTPWLYDDTDPNSGPEETTITRQQHTTTTTTMHTLINTLSPAEQQLLHLRYHHELRLRQIAMEMGRTTKAVNNLHTRTLRRLRNLYEQVAA